MRVVVSGASGLIGSALVPHLRGRGHDVRVLVRREPRSADEVRWDPATRVLDPGALGGVDGVVHLSGAGVADRRWTADYRRTILRSRVDSTDLLARTLAGLDQPPRALVCASGVDYYRAGPEPVIETSPSGDSFLAEVCRAWEGAADPAREAGIAVTHLRTGIVLAQRGGAMGQLGRLVRLGLGGPLGSGRQWWSWITLPDHVAATTLLLERAVDGPVNLTSPQPTRQAEVARALAHAVRRPALLPAPALALRLALGEFAETILADRRVLPDRLTELGMEYAHPDLASAAGWVMAEPDTSG
jgi:uncharacterized protein